MPCPELRGGNETARFYKGTRWGNGGCLAAHSARPAIGDAGDWISWSACVGALRTICCCHHSTVLNCRSGRWPGSGSPWIVSLGRHACLCKRQLHFVYRNFFMTHTAALSHGLDLVDATRLSGLTEKAGIAPRRRSHLLLHASPEDQVQRLLIAAQPSAYVQPPHQHSQQWEFLILQRDASMF
jgi:hypothetical protein